MDSGELLEHYKYKHETDPLFSKGSSLFKHIPYLARIIDLFRVKTILDYGCGKATWWNWKYRNATFNNDELRVRLYDPAVPKYDKLPGGRFDLVVCTDVLEHLHPDDTDEIVERLVGYTRRHLFVCIALTEAKKTFPDGTNLHTNLHTQEWWEELFARKVDEFEKKHRVTISYAISFNDAVFF